MNNINGFLPIASENSEILILGSMPGAVSLIKQEYYGNARNSFWPIIWTVFSDQVEDEKHSYKKCIDLLSDANIALWDVLQSCDRIGSLDSAIKMDTIKVNDFQSFFVTHEKIKKVLFNGKKAEALYKKNVLSTIYKQFGYLQYTSLPSTSPAYAAMNLIEKTSIWEKQLLNHKSNYRSRFN